MLTSSAGKSKKSRLIKSEISLSARTITFLKLYHTIQPHFLNPKNWRCFDQFLQNPKIGIYFMSNNRQRNQVQPDPLRRFSSTSEIFQATIPGKWLHYYPFLRLGHKSRQSTPIRMNQLCHIDLDGSYRIFHQAWTMWTCRPILSIY